MRKKVLLLWCAALLPGLLPAGAPVISVWELGKEEPHFYLSQYDVKKQKASYETMDDGTRALKVDLANSLRHTWDGRFRSYRIMPDFTKAVLKLRYFVPEKCGVVRVTLLLCDRYNEWFPLEFVPKKTPGWHTVSFPLDGTKKQEKALKTSLRAGYDVKREGGRVGYFDYPMRVIGINGTAAVQWKSFAHWIGFGPMTLEVTKSDTAIRPALDTGTPFHALRKGDEKRLALAFFNPEETAYQGSVDWTVTDAYGMVVETRHEKVGAAGGETCRIPLPCPPKYGVYTVKFVSHGDGKQDLALTQSFCYLDPTGATPKVRADGFLFGVTTQPQWWRFDIETEAEAMALCGVKVVRNHTGWAFAQSDPELPLSQAYNDDALEPFNKLGIEFQPSLMFPPKRDIDLQVKPLWPSSKDWIKYCPTETAWRTYCRSYFTHNKGKIRFYEIWNEPNLPLFANFSQRDYVRLLRIAHEELQKIDPEAKILTAGYAGRTSIDHMRATAKETAYYDVLATHGHVPYPEYRQHVDLVTQTLREVAPQKSWYANEAAISANVTGELEQGNHLFKKLLYAWANGSIGYTWHNARNDGFDPVYVEHGFGMLTRDFYPKAVYGVYNNLTKRLTGAKFLQPLRQEPAIEGYLFQAKNGDLYYGFWGWNAALPYRLKNVTGKATLIDLFGNETPLKVEQNSVVLPVKKEGQFLRLQHASALPELAGRVKSFASSPRLQAAAVIPQGGLPEKPQFVLNQKENVEPPFRWEGPADCSAEVRLAREAGDLHIRVDVTDDHFCQQWHGYDTHRGDGVILTLALPSQAGSWVMGFVRKHRADEVEMWCYSRPVGSSGTPKFRAAVSKFVNHHITYDVWLPLSELGFTQEDLENGFHFNCCVTDHDGHGRKNLLDVCTSFDYHNFPVLICR